MSTQPMRYGFPITLARAKLVAEAAEAEAARNGWAMVIAIIDSGGNLAVLHKMDSANLGSLAIAQAKAQTAVDFRRPTKTYEDAVAAGGLGLRLLSADGICALEGGLPLVESDTIVGAIGVSGATATQDAQVAAAGVKALSS